MTFDHQAADVGYVPFGMGHNVLNTDDEPPPFLEMFRGDRFADDFLSSTGRLLPRFGADAPYQPLIIFSGVRRRPV